MVFELIRYSADKAAEWDAFVRTAKNATFLFERAYMDYHADRFHDCSLMAYRKGRLYALLPACDDGQGTWWSHRGLTYGGLIMSAQCRAAEVCELFGMLNRWLAENGFSKVVYKHVPWIYALLPAEEDLFALQNVCHAVVRSRDIASVVDLRDRLPLSTLRRRGVKKALALGLQIRMVDAPADFWPLLEENLWSSFKARPVHTLEEISLLQRRFPENIVIYGIYQGDVLLGGTVLYVCGRVVKTQYISACEEGKRTGAIDLLFCHLLDKFAEEKKTLFDFGTSNKVVDDALNEPLIFQKEGFGARAVCYDTYEWSLGE